MSFQTSGFLTLYEYHRGSKNYRVESNPRDGELESIDRMAVFPVERPRDGLVKLLDGNLGLFGDMAHDRVAHLALVVSLLALDDILRRYTSLRKIDIPCLFVSRPVATQIMPQR